MAKKPNSKPIPQPQAAPALKTATANPIVNKNMFSIRNLCVALAALSFLLYINTIGNGYILDDVMVLKDNTIVTKGFAGVWELLVTPHMRGYLIIPNDLYRPLSLVMFAIEYQFFGPNPVVGHLFNVIWFMGCVVMLFLFLSKLFGHGRLAIAFVAALIFAVHPIHTEVVANIKSRDELMCYFFAFWSLNLFANYMRGGKMLHLILGTFILYLSLISKETVIAFLGIIPFIFFFYKNEDKRRAILITAGSVVAVCIFMAVRTAVLNAYDANQPGAPVEFIDNALSGSHGIEKWATIAKVMGMYLKLMFIPYPLLCNYSFNAIEAADLGSPSFWLSLLAYGALIYVAITRWLKDNKDLWAFSIIFFLATLFLFSNIPFLMGAELAERFAFFASTSVCIAVALAIEKWLIKDGDTSNIMTLKNSKVLMVLLPLCLLFGGMTIARNMDWKDELTLYKTDSEKSPRDCRLYHYIGTAMAETLYPAETDSLKKQQIDIESMEYLRKALAIYPKFTEAHVEMGRIFDRKKMYDSAIVHDKIALSLNETHPTANNNLGSVLLTAGKYRESILYLQRSIMVNPNFKFAYVNLARSYSQLKAYDSAIMNYNKYLAFEPNADAELELGTSYYMLAKFDSADYHYKRVLTIDPNNANAAHNIGAIYLNQKNFPEAINFFKKTIAIEPNHMNAYSNLSHAYYFSGQYALAIETINQAFQMDKNPRDIPYIALAYQKMGNMAEAKRWEAISKQYYSNFKLE